MKIISLPALLASLILVATSPVSGRAADAPKSDRPKIYDESADGTKQIAEALAIAKKEDKRVLLQFGANWCSWCHKLHKLLASDKPIGEKLKADFVVVLIDVDKEHNKSLVAKYGGQSIGLPFIVILDAEGKHVTTKNTGELEEGDHHSPEKVMAFLKASSPKK
jgi:thioredoxin-related protein